jgi:tetratricopeptide (TPR) repeat protein
LLVGREEERAALRQMAIDATKAQTLRMVQIRGPGGMAGAELIRDLVVQQRSRGVPVLQARFSPEPGDGYEPGRAVARYLGLGALSGRALDKAFGQAVRGWPWSSTLVLEGLRTLIQPEYAPSDPGEALLRNGLMLRFLQRLHDLTGQLVLLVLDEAQWSWAALELAQHLASELIEFPLLVLLKVRDDALLYRSEELEHLATLDQDPRSEMLALGPLRADQAELLGRRLGLNAAEAREAAARSEGVPVSMVLLAADQRERGALLHVDSVEGVHQARVALTVEPGSEGWRALELAAVLGLRVNRTLWERACRLAEIEPPPRLVAQLMRRGLVTRTVGGFGFGWVTMRAAFLSSARQTGRLEGHHLACARALHDDRSRSALERRALHLLRAERPMESVEPLLEAAERRLETGDAVDAVRLLLRRERVLDRMSAAQEGPRARGLTLKARALRAVGEAHEAREAAVLAERLARWSGRLDLRAAALTEQARCASAEGELGEALVAMREAQDLLAECGDGPSLTRATLELARLLSDLGALEEAQALYQGEAESLKAMTDLGPLADAMRGVGGVALRQHRPADAQKALEASARLYERLGDAWGAVGAHNALGGLHRACGDLEQAEVHYGRSARIVRGTGVPEAMLPDLQRGLVRVQLGRDIEALRPLERCIQWFQQRDDTVSEAVARMARVVALAGLGNWRAAEAEVVAVLDAVDASGATHADLALCARLAGDRAAARDRTPLAGELYRLALQQHRVMGNRGHVADLRRRIGNLDLTDIME